MVLVFLQGYYKRWRKRGREKIGDGILAQRNINILATTVMLPSSQLLTSWVVAHMHLHDHSMRAKSTSYHRTLQSLNSANTQLMPPSLFEPLIR